VCFFDRHDLDDSNITLQDDTETLRNNCGRFASVEYEHNNESHC
jgi:hypothetical protein